MRYRCEIPPVGPAAELAARMSALVPELRTERLHLRAPTLADFDAYAQIVCGPRGAYVGGPMSREDAWFDFVQLASCWYFHGHGGWTIEQDGQVMGFVILGLEPGDAEPELGFLLLPQAEGHGIAREAAEAARTHARYLGLPSLVSYIDAANSRSRALAERLGAHRDPAAEAQIGEPDLCVYRHAMEQEH